MTPTLFESANRYVIAERNLRVVQDLARWSTEKLKAAPEPERDRLSERHRRAESALVLAQAEVEEAAKLLRETARPA